MALLDKAQQDYFRQKRKRQKEQNPSDSAPAAKTTPGRTIRVASKPSNSRYARLKPGVAMGLWRTNL